MGLLGVHSSSALIEPPVELRRYRNNLPTTLIKPSCLPRMRTSFRKQRSQIRCSLSKEAPSPLELEEDGSLSTSTSTSLEGEEEEEFSHVIKFNLSDFNITDRVSIGLGGRGDEAVFEAIVKDVDSPMHNTKVVLRRLTTARAQRRGKRSIQVLKKLVRRKLMYHSYSMQVHGYVCSQTMEDVGSFTLVHGYHGSFSLRHWLRQTDWLPTLEATLALDEESVRRVGDDTVGGPAVSRQLRVIRILMRDLLIGVRFRNCICDVVTCGCVHKHTSMYAVVLCQSIGRIFYVSVDFLLQVGILGNAADFSEDGPNNPDRQQMMIAFDMRCLGFIMVKMILRELMDPIIFTKFKAFLNKGNDPSCLREFLLRTFNRNSSHGNVGLQMLDRNWGAGWHLLSLLLAPRPLDRISVLVGKDWPHDKIGIDGKLVVNSTFRLTSGKRLYMKGEDENLPAIGTNAQESAIKKLSGKRWRKALRHKELPSSLPVVKLVSSDIDVALILNEPLSKDIEAAQFVVNEVRTQIPPEMFDLSKIVCGTYIDSRMMVLRSVNGSALLFTRACSIKS
ncbi:hypothetical protein M8C21_004452 [Ambrosia artemisiifolia]|uniref:Uncharacterized protein n=1 Tax=Ambrosia artemisiifolia TaxID=4212 RepID=A0AAD5G775_AMBAR|nr:hypothetical protein M8C21_004452 [Ambrosia artemisiifolia]